MELLVKKASMALFLREQLSYHERRILSEVQSNEVITHGLSEISEIKIKLKALDEEIELSPDVNFLRAVIKDASRRMPTIDEVTEGMPQPIKLLIRFMTFLPGFTKL
ncbi:hypothetical protein [Dryocola sp. BD626]|uniref:hypothetical protein n=1 Tax=Dryocola sp. BD626 TaxID=3133273 RepID=UPI003F4F7EF8